ncbi:MAG: hypothetical protein KGZ58_12935 [Ignavibacteriales bacterium]|nr:hypothetical protein [Ignavibacteriales bacterium]
MATKNQNVQNSNSIIVSVGVALIKEGDSIVAYCPALELSSYGDTKKEARSAFEEALKIFLKETMQKGTLEKFLLKLGWSLNIFTCRNFFLLVP